MKTYNIKITFESKCNEEDLKDENNLIYDFIYQNFWNIKNFKYEYKQQLNRKDKTNETI